MRKYLFPVLLGAISLVLTAAFLELAVRYGVDDGMQFDLEMWKYARDVKVVSADPAIGHEHGPNRQAHLMGVDVATSSQGLRDRDFPLERKEGVKRIVMVGDSLTFGWGVPFEDLFSKRIEKLYADAGETVEVINTGVGNWNTMQEVAYFLDKGKDFKPDIVVLNYFVNDAEPVPQNRQRPSLLMRNCYACVFLAGRLDMLKRLFFGGPSWDAYYLGLYGSGEAPGWLDAKAAIKRLADYCKANGITLVVASLPELHDVKNYPFDQVTQLVKEAASENGAVFVDLLPSVSGEASEALWVTPPDPHPNAFANELIAAGLFAALRELEKPGAN
jgi:lysophospholipase L1-like esterase